MKKPEILYHGRHDKVEVIPLEQGSDLSGIPENNLFAVYATSRKDNAVFYALRVKDSKFDFSFIGRVYFLPSDSFVNLIESKLDYVSFTPVKPLRFELIYPIQYLHYMLNRYWSCRYGDTPCYGKYIVTTSELIKDCSTGISMESINESDAKTVAKRVLYMELNRILNAYDCGEVGGEELAKMLRKLENNWEEYIA